MTARHCIMATTILAVALALPVAVIIAEWLGR